MLRINILLFKEKKGLFKKLLFFLIILGVFLINSQYVSYPDEFVNLLGGRFINQGQLPYVNFFDHHLPLPWYLAALLLKLSFQSFILFRLYWALFSFLVLLILGLWIRKDHRSLYRYYLGFLILYPLLSVYFWLHLFLADSLASLFFSLTFWILIAETIHNKSRFKVVLMASLLTGCLIFSSLTFFYVGLILYLWQIYLLKFDFKKILLFCALSALPYLIYFLYLVLTGSFHEFYFANIVYNANYYINIPNFTKGKFFNPIKFGFTLIYNFWSNYLPTLTTLKDLNLYLPIPTLVALSTLTLLIILSIKNALLGIFFFLILSFSTPRGNIKITNETDYQIGLYLTLGLVSSFVVLYLLRNVNIKDVLVNDVKRLLQVIISVLLFFTFIFLVKNTYDRWYSRYTQKMPSIQNSAPIAQFFDEILKNDDYYWAGPYEPQELFFVKKARLPGKYISLLPQFKENDKLKREFIEQFEKKPPAVIVFKKDTGIYLTPANEFGDFFLSWMKDKYTPLEEIKDLTVLKSPTNLKLGSHLYLLNSQKNRLLISLEEKKYISLP